jgi:hypothetical protein
MSVGAVFVQGLIGYFITIVVALATAGLIAGLVKGLRALQAPEAPPAVAARPAAGSAVPDEAEIARRVAVVAAAVATMAGRTRIVRIEEAALPGLWRQTGRALHHRSHTPHR